MIGRAERPDVRFEFIVRTVHRPLREPPILRTSEEKRPTTNKSYTETSSNEASGAERSYRITQGRLHRLCAPSTHTKTNQSTRIRLLQPNAKDTGSFQIVEDRRRSVRFQGKLTRTADMDAREYYPVKAGHERAKRVEWCPEPDLNRHGIATPGC